MTETAYYWTGNPNDERKEYFQEHIQEILKAVKAMAKDAGIKDVATLAPILPAPGKRSAR